MSLAATSFSEPLSELGLCPRIQDALLNGGCATVDDVLSLTAHQIRSMTGGGNPEIDAIFNACNRVMNEHLRQRVMFAPPPSARKPAKRDKGLVVRLSHKDHLKLETLARQRGIDKRSVAAMLITDSLADVEVELAACRGNRDVRSARNEVIYNAVQGGMTARRAGSVYGLSGTRVSQIVHREHRKRMHSERANQRRSADDDALLDCTLDELELSVRAANAIKNMGIKTVRELVSVKDWELLRAPNFGRVSLAQLKDALWTHGLRMPVTP